MELETDHAVERLGARTTFSGTSGVTVVVGRVVVEPVNRKLHVQEGVEVAFHKAVTVASVVSEGSRCTYPLR